MKYRATAVIATLALSAPATSQASKTETEVTLDLITINYRGAFAEYYGDVTSPRKACRHERKVRVYRKLPGQNERIGATRAFDGPGPGASWYLTKNGAPQEGRYFATVEANDKCTGDRSQVLGYQEIRSGLGWSSERGGF